MKNGCRKPRCKPIVKRCCRKFGRRKRCHPRYCKKHCPKYRPKPCKGGQKMVFITMKNGCKKPICRPRSCCRAKIASCLACSAGMSVLKYCKKNPFTIGCKHVPDRPGPHLPSNFNCKCYLDRYADLRRAFGRNCGKAANHYITHGQREKRDPTCSKPDR